MTGRVVAVGGSTSSSTPLLSRAAVIYDVGRSVQSSGRLLAHDLPPLAANFPTFSQPEAQVPTKIYCAVVQVDVDRTVSRKFKTGTNAALMNPAQLACFYVHLDTKTGAKKHPIEQYTRRHLRARAALALFSFYVLQQLGQGHTFYAGAKQQQLATTINMVSKRSM